MRPALIALLLLAAASSVSAQAPRIERIDLVDYGIYESEVTRRIEDSKAVGGSRSGVKMIRIKEKTSTIQARKGLQFGIRFFVVGEPKEAEVRLKFVLRFPRRACATLRRGYELSQRVAFAPPRSDGLTSPAILSTTIGKWCPGMDL